MKISDAGVALIREFEGCELRAYPDPGTGGEPFTIGVGHTGGVKPGDVITEDRALELLREDIEEFEDAVDLALDGAPVTQNQYDAMVSLAFNIGGTAFGSSTLARLIKAGNVQGAAGQFLRWDKAAGKTMAGLTRRRQAERDLFLS